MKLPCGLLLSIFLTTGVTGVCAQGLDPALNVDLPTTAIHGSDIAHVDLQSGALTINIPLVHLKGRGLDTDFMYTVGNKNWHYEYIQTESVGFYNLYFDFGSLFPRIGQTRMGTWDGPLGGTILSPDLPYGLVASTFTQNTGPVSTLINVEGVIGTQPANPTGYWSFDGSYMYGDPVTGWLYYKDGVRTKSTSVRVDDSYIQNDNILEDTNGNTITCTGIDGSATSSCIDTLGRHIDFSYGSNSNSVSYLDSSNIARTATVVSSGSQPLNYPWRPTVGICDPTYGYSNNCVAVSTGTCPLNTAITLGDGSTYHLYYVQNADRTTTCEVSKIELPTGGYIRFEYGWLGTGAVVPNDPYTAMQLASHRAVIKRFESSDGTAGSEKVWSYSYTCTNGNCGEPTGAAYTETTTVVDPLQNTHTETFYQGIMFDGNPAPIPYVTMTEDRDSFGVLLRRTDNTTAFDSTSYSVLRTDQIRDNPRVTSTVETLGGSSQTSTTAMQYDAYGNVNDKKYYDFDSSLLRWEEHTYLPTSNPSYAANNVHILDRVTIDIVHGDSSTCTSPVADICSQSTYTYDTYSNGLTSIAGIVQHDDVDRGSSYLTRGNVTAQAQYVYPTAEVQQRSLSYDSFGNVRGTTDWKGNPTTYDYADNFSGAGPSAATYARPTTITRPATNGVSHIERREYYWNTGLLAAICGENFPSGSRCDIQAALPAADFTAYQYDAVNRPTRATFGDGGYTALSYPDFNHINQTNAIGLDKTATYDGLGRQISVETTSVSPHLRQETGYDAVGRVALVTNPFSPGNPQPTDGATKYQYDGLGRKTLQIQPDETSSNLSRLTWSHRGSTVVSTDEANHQTKRTSDSMGRLVQVLEPDPNTGVPSLETDYAYVALGNLRTVNQHGTSSEAARNRTFQYDGLSRLTSSTNPETGTINYGYDANGNLTAKPDARGVTTAYSYDTLNRLISKTYSGGNAAATRSSCYQYDNAPNGIGRLGAEWTQVGSCSSAPPNNPETRHSILAYDAMGRITGEQQCHRDKCSAPTTSTMHYDLAGNPTYYSNGIGSIELSQTYDAAGRLQTIGSSLYGTQLPSYPATLFSVGAYTPAGSIQNMNLGPVINVNRTYDNRLRITGQTVTHP